jgi:phage shock protein A
MSADPLVLLGQLREKLKEQYIESARAWAQVKVLRRQLQEQIDDKHRILREYEAVREALAAHQQVGA